MGFDPCFLGMAPVQFLLACTAFEQAAHDDEKQRYEHHRQHGASDHATEHAGADGALAGRASARGQHQGHHTQAKGHGGHDDGAETQVSGLNGCGEQAFALGL